MVYTQKVMDHFANPHNVGEIDNPDGVGDVGSPQCGDTTRITIKVVGDRIADIKFKTFGCAAAIASSSMATEMIKGMTLDEALAVTNKQVVDELGGLPAAKIHCSVMAADGVRAAIEDYRSKQEHGLQNLG